MKRWLNMAAALAAVLLAGSAVVSANGQPDLVPTQVIATTVYEDLANSVSVVVANGGTAPSGPFSTTLRTSDGQAFTQSVAPVDPAGWPAYVNYSWTPAASGPHILTFTVDATGVVAESNEANNVITRAVNVLPLAPVTVAVRVEGRDANIFSGTVSVFTSVITDSTGVTHTLDRPTALGALAAAAQTGAFTYVVSSAWGSLYVSAVAGEAAVGWDGWLYRVDWVSPDVGAADYALGPANARVLWYYGAWGAQPLSLTLSAASVELGQPFEALVKAYDDFTASWSPVPMASVFAASYTFTTDVGGRATIVGLPPGRHTLFAAKGSYAEYTRSNAESVYVRPLVDINGDGVVGIADLVYIAARFGARLGDTLYSPQADLNSDGWINIFDLVRVAINYGRSY